MTDPVNDYTQESTTPPAHGVAQDVSAQRAERPAFNWTYETLSDLVHLFNALYEKHREIVMDTNPYNLNKTYAASYEEVRSEYPRLWPIRLNGLLSQYCDQIKKCAVGRFTRLAKDDVIPSDPVCPTDRLEESRHQRRVTCPCRCKHTP